MSTMSNAAKRIRGLIRETYRWCDNPRMDLRAQTLKGIKKFLASKDPESAGRAVACLWSMSGWYAQQGVRAVLEGNINGWAQIDRAFHYLAPSAQVVKPGVAASEPACVLANAVVFGEEATAQAVAARLLASLEDGTIMWDFSPFGAFMLKLWGIYQRREIDMNRPRVASLGVYQEVLNAWHEDSALADALRAACDYHIEQTLDRSPYPEFVWLPYRLFPVDILVVGEIRRRLGLSTPQVDHPLLDTPLAKVPPPEERPRMGPDPLLDEVMARARQDGLIT